MKVKITVDDREVYSGELEAGQVISHTLKKPKPETLADIPEEERTIKNLLNYYYKRNNIIGYSILAQVDYKKFNLINIDKPSNRFSTGAHVDGVFEQLSVIQMKDIFGDDWKDWGLVENLKIEEVSD